MFVGDSTDLDQIPSPQDIVLAAKKKSVGF